MLLGYILSLVISVCITAVVLYIKHKFTAHKANVLVDAFICALCILVVTLSIYAPSVADAVNEGGMYNPIFKFGDGISLRYDTESEEYFVYSFNAHRLFNPCERYEIDQDYAKEIVAHIDALNEATLPADIHSK